MWKLLIFIFITHLGYSQVEVGSLIEEMPNDSILPLTLNNHTGIRPFNRVNNNFQHKFSLKSVKNSSKIAITPIVDLGLQIDNATSYKTGLGATITGIFKNKLYYKFSAIQGVGEASEKLFQPKSYVFNQKTGKSFTYTDIRGRLSYTANKFFNFQAGLDHNFIGEGNRSLLLSDYGKPYPFAKIRANCWRFDYTALYQFYREQAPNEQWKSKYSAAHLLSFNATKGINFSFFESVVFSPKDTNLNRGFDAEYLNPIIFYRPQEYALGSSDNTFMGFQFSAKYKKHTFYGQGMFDDFLLAEMRARSRYWSNKYAGQIGIKGRFNSNNKKFFYRVEANFARPYTYSHKNSSQNYGNQGYALAHPYGASFYEILGELKWQKSNWIFKIFCNYYLRGIDKNDGISYGGNIYQSYDSHPYEYQNKIGQGVKLNGVHGVFTTAYLLDKASNLQLFLENHFQGNTLISNHVYYLVLGLRSNLWNDYRNY